MKHANRIAFLVVVMILSAASQATAQSASDQARLEAYRWGVEFARDQVGKARNSVGEARERLDNIEELLDESLEKARRCLEELDELLAEPRGIAMDDIVTLSFAKVRFELQVANSQKGLTFTSLVDARRVAAESRLATSEAFLAVSEALLAAAEGGDETALQVTAEAYTATSGAASAASEAFLDILEIEDSEPGGMTAEALAGNLDICQVGFNFAPSAAELHLAWSSAVLAALAAERAKAIVDILAGGAEEIPPELLKPLPTKFGPVA